MSYDLNDCCRKTLGWAALCGERLCKTEMIVNERLNCDFKEMEGVEACSGMSNDHSLKSEESDSKRRGRKREAVMMALMAAHAKCGISKRALVLLIGGYARDDPSSHA